MTEMAVNVPAPPVMRMCAVACSPPGGGALITIDGGYRKPVFVLPPVVPVNARGATAPPTIGHQVEEPDDGVTVRVVAVVPIPVTDPVALPVTIIAATGHPVRLARRWFEPSNDQVCPFPVSASACVRQFPVTGSRYCSDV